MRLNLFIFIIVLVKASFGQLSKADYYNAIDNKIYTLSKNESLTLDSLIKYVKINFISPEDKVRAFYSWVAQNIIYDINHLNNMVSLSKMNVKMQSGISQNADTVFIKKKAVCEGYSLLLHKLLESCSIPSYVIGGYTKTPEGEINTEILHTWNAVKIDSTWQLIDVTWSGGYVNAMNQYVKRFSDKYFLSKPEEFIKDHLPLDPMWQLLIAPASKNSFFEANNNSTYASNFNFTDSIAKHLSKPAAEQKRLNYIHHLSFDPDNNKYKLQLDILTYNTAGDVLLEASLHFNQFMEFQTKKMGKFPTASNCKKAKKLLEIPKNDLNKTIEFIANNPAYTTEYAGTFKEMLASANTNLNNIKKTIEEINTYMKQNGMK